MEKNDNNCATARIIYAIEDMSDLRIGWLIHRLTLSFMGQAQSARLTISPYGLFAADFFELADMITGGEVLSDE